MLKFASTNSHRAKKLSSAMRQAQALPPSESSEDMGYYNEKMLQYCHWVQCLSMLERLLLNKKGRDLFPVKLPDMKGQRLV